MPYRYTKFFDTPLPDRMPEDDLGTGNVESVLLDSIGGVVNYYGPTRRKLPRRDIIDYRGIYVAEKVYLVDEAGNFIVDEAGNRILVAAAGAHLRQQVHALRAQIGRTGPLWRMMDDTGLLAWKTATLLSVEYTRTINDAGETAELRPIWETGMGAWRDETASAFAKSLTAGVLTPVTVHNDGDVEVLDAVITVARTSGTITAFSLTAPGISLSWAGAFGAGQSLIIDTGAQTVRVGTINAYSGFALGTGHTVRGWLTLSPGITPLVARVMGGNANITVSFYNQRL